MNEENEEFKKKMEELGEHFGGLVSDETLRLLASYSLGHVSEINIDDAVNFRGKVTVKGSVLKIYGVKDFSSSKGDGTVGSILLKLMEYPNEDAIVRAVFWNDAARVVEKLSEGDTVKLRGHVRKRDENVEISVNQSSDVEIIEKKIREISGAYIGKIEDKEVTRAAILSDDGVHKFIAESNTAEKLKKLRTGSSIKVTIMGAGKELNAIDIEEIEEEFKIEFTPVSKLAPLKISNLRGRVSGFGKLKSFKNRTLAEIYLSDETDRVKLILWDDNISIYRKADIGDTIEVYNGYPKVGWDGELEVHCGWICIIMLRTA
ncbi:MAG TPA: hypothetical protein EYP30_08050 [Archaeoglobaceae archaeon]|nr:hypothetical protein [Archaeoglobaceae archaeon]